jgi:hypothetical protein
MRTGGLLSGEKAADLGMAVGSESLVGYDSKKVLPER